MASLVMTIESSDDENTASPKKPSNDGDLVMAGKEGDALFVESDSESDELGYGRKEDGSKAATWSFKEQMTVGNK